MSPQYKSTEPERLLIVNADDFGLTRSVSDGIITALKSGIVTSTTVMANCVSGNEIELLAETVSQLTGKPLVGSTQQPDETGIGVEASAKAERSGTRDLIPSVGVHINLTFGRPMSSKWGRSYLDDRGNFSSKFRQSPEAARSFPEENIHDEAIKQIDKVKGAGLKITHLDTHHHIHQYDNVLDVLRGIAKNQGYGMRTLNSVHRELLRRDGIQAPSKTIVSFYGKKMISEEALLAELSRTDGSVIELMCHPGLNSDALKRVSRYTEEREQELELLCSPSLREKISSVGFALASYHNLLFPEK